MLKLYGFARVNKGARGNTRDLRVLWALEEIGVPYEIVGLDHPNHDLDSPAYRALNPFGQIPVIDDDGVVVSESGAILLYLARKDSKPSEALQDWAEMRLKQLDGWLANRRFIATEDFTVADILMTHVLDAGTQQEMLKPYPNILAYRARCTERPAWKKTLEAYC